MIFMAFEGYNTQAIWITLAILLWNYFQFVLMIISKYEV